MLTVRRAISSAKVLAKAWIGYDFFISYAQADGAEHAVRLAGLLSARDFAVFLDREDLHGGEDLSVTLRAALARTRCLVVVGTEGALRSNWVADEVNAFKYRRRIVIVDVDGIRTKQQWVDSENHLFLRSAGSGGSGIIDRIAQGTRRQRVLVRARQVAFAAGVAFSAVTAASIVSYLEAEQRRSAQHGQAARAAARVPCLDPNGLVDGLLGISEVPAWRGGPHPDASYGLSRLLDRARRERRIECHAQPLVTSVTLTRDTAFVQCGEELISATRAWPPATGRAFGSSVSRAPTADDVAVRKGRTITTTRGAFVLPDSTSVELFVQDDGEVLVVGDTDSWIWTPGTTHPTRTPLPKSEGWFPATVGRDWTALGTERGVSIRRGGQWSHVPWTPRPWRLSGSVDGSVLAWLDEENRLVFMRPGEPPAVIDTEVHHASPLLVSRDGTEMVSARSGEALSSHVVIWTRNGGLDEWSAASEVALDGGALRKIVEVANDGVFIVGTDTDGVTLWSGFGRPQDGFRCPGQTLRDIDVVSGADTVLIGWEAEFATLWEPLATRAVALEPRLQVVLGGTVPIVIHDDGKVVWPSGRESSTGVTPNSYVKSKDNSALVLGAGERWVSVSETQVTSLGVGGRPVAFDVGARVVVRTAEGDSRMRLTAETLEGDTLWDVPIKTEVQVAEWTPTESHLIVATENEVQRMDALTGETLWRQGVDATEAISFSPNNVTVLASGAYGEHAVLALASGEVVWRDGNSLWSNAVYLDSSTVLSGNADGRITAYRLSDGAAKWNIFVDPAGIHRLVAAADRSLVAVETYGSIHFLDVPARRLTASVDVPSRWAEGMTFVGDELWFQTEREEGWWRFSSSTAQLTQEACALALELPDLSERLGDVCEANGIARR